MTEVYWKVCDWSPNYYMVRVFENNEYTGRGGFLKNWNQVIEYAKYYKAVDLVHVTEE